jgi:hypothetical protein
MVRRRLEASACSTTAGQEEAIQTYHEPRLVRDPQAVLVERARDVVLLDVRHGRRVALNSVAASLWVVLATEPTLAALVETVWTRYDVRADILVRDVAVTLATWLDDGLIAWR